MTSLVVIIITLCLTINVTARHSCSCFCPTRSKFIGAAFSDRCSQSACSQACVSTWPAVCTSMVNTYGHCTKHSSPPPHNCVCKCSAFPSCPSSTIGFTYASTCSKLACQVACSIDYPSTCGTYYNDAHCQKAMSDSVLQIRAKFTVIAWIATVLVFMSR